MKSILALFLLLIPSCILAQINGTVKDESGELLPYVNIYVKNTSSGTTTNTDGKYTLKIKPGIYDISYQYVGYKTVNKKINLSGAEITEDVILYPEDYKLDQIVISANAEDPAYAIIRKAQAKRNYYKDKLSNFECDVYVRGFTKVNDAPEKIMGFEVGDMEGMLDSTRQGVVYLSESVSRLYQKGNKNKEVMFSSKISGDDQGYSFNSAKEMNFNFYDNRISLNKELVSPIAKGAMAYYRYQLEGAQMDENGYLINKIRVIPKNEFSPAFYGHIYITEDLWNIHSLELGVTSKSTQLPFIDSLKFKQIYIPLENDNWVKFSNVIKFQMAVFGFEFEGNFAAVYSDYLIGQVDESIFGNEVFKVEKEANERTEDYWDEIRPIPLTNEQRVDYVKKDSIRLVRESPEYLDSVDREANKFKPNALIGGYSYSNSQNFSRFNINSPLSDISFNTIQGWNSKLSLSYYKAKDKKRTRSFNATLNANYGLSEEVLRVNGRLDFLLSRYHSTRLTLFGGQDIEQYSRRNPISYSLNSIYTVLFDRNYLKAFDKKFFRIRLQRDLGNTFWGSFSLSYQDRSALINNHQCDDEKITSNYPLKPQNFGQLAFDDHQMFILRASLRIKIGEEIWNYPDDKLRAGSSWPTFWVHYKKAVKILGGDHSYDLLYATAYKNYNISTIGNVELFASGGKFLKRSLSIPFVDFYHFMGNQTHVGNPSNYYNRFLMLPYYDFSTREQFFEGHIQHNFQGFLLNKIPLIKKLQWHLVAGYKHLAIPSNTYQEFHLGLDNIGIKVFRLFRVDAVWSTNLNPEIVGKYELGIIGGLKLDL